MFNKVRGCRRNFARRVTEEDIIAENNLSSILSPICFFLTVNRAVFVPEIQRRTSVVGWNRGCENFRFSLQESTTIEKIGNRTRCFLWSLKLDTPSNSFSRIPRSKHVLRVCSSFSIERRQFKGKIRDTWQYPARNAAYDGCVVILKLDFTLKPWADVKRTDYNLTIVILTCTFVFTWIVLYVISRHVTRQMANENLHLAIDNVPPLLYTVYYIAIFWSFVG